MGQFAALQKQRIEGFEELVEVVPGTRREVVQLERGKFHGEIAHAVVGDLPIDMASFNRGIRTRGGSHKERIDIGMIADSSDRVMRCSYDSRPGDILVLQPDTVSENRYYGGASVIVVTALASDIEATFAMEDRLRDALTGPRQHFKGNAETALMIPQLRLLIGRLGDAALTEGAAEFWKHTIIEAITTDIAAAMPSEVGGPLPCALRIVRQVEEYLESQPQGVVHI